MQRTQKKERLTLNHKDSKTGTQEFQYLSVLMSSCEPFLGAPTELYRYLYADNYKDFAPPELLPAAQNVRTPGPFSRGSRLY
jgi:hypothetical protein